MMRLSNLTFALTLGTATSAAFAQPVMQAPSVPPSERASSNAVPDAPDAVPPSRTITVETREKGQVTGATVTRGSNTYHLRPNAQVGSALPGDVQSSGNRAAQWQVFQFDWQREPDAAVKAPAPPPPEK